MDKIISANQVERKNKQNINNALKSPMYPFPVPDPNRNLQPLFQVLCGRN